MKQITIYELLPLLKKGWVGFDCNEWWWFSKKPKADEVMQEWENFYQCCILACFNIAPFDGDWKDSLIKVEHKEEE